MPQLSKKLYLLNPIQPRLFRGYPGLETYLLRTTNRTDTDFPSVTIFDYRTDIDFPGALFSGYRTDFRFLKPLSHPKKIFHKKV